MKHLSKNFLKEGIRKGEIFKLLLDQKVTEADDIWQKKRAKSKIKRLEYMNRESQDQGQYEDFQSYWWTIICHINTGHIFLNI